MRKREDTVLKEVIVVEGKSDIVRVRKAVDAEMIATEGFTLRAGVIEKIRQAYDKRGIIILTDPDGAGERIRKYLAERFPAAKHAFIPREEAKANGDIGVEQASPESIRRALSKVRTSTFVPEVRFTMVDLVINELNGTAAAQNRRAILGAALGIGYSNAKQFLYRLNHYDVTRQEWQAGLTQLKESEQGEKI